MSEPEICAILVAIGIALTVINLIVVALSLKLYTEYFKERVKGKKKIGDKK